MIFADREMSRSPRHVHPSSCGNSQTACGVGDPRFIWVARNGCQVIVGFSLPLFSEVLSARLDHNFRQQSSVENQIGLRSMWVKCEPTRTGKTSYHQSHEAAAPRPDKMNRGPFECARSKTAVA
jgi:hypothetical protein